MTRNFGAGSIFGSTSIAGFEPTGGAIDITYHLGYEVTFDLPVSGPFVAEDFQGLNCSGSGTEISRRSNSQDISLPSLSGSYDLSAGIAAFLLGTVSVNYTPAFVEQLSGTSEPANSANLALSVTGGDLVMPVSLSYTYTPQASLPEPNELIAIGLGFVGLGWFGRGKKARR